LTAVVPGFFGDSVRAEYWGRWFYWESCAYVGVAAAALVILGVWRASDRSAVWRDVALAAALVVLALGAYTPLFHVLFRVVPGYGLFRGSSKFLFFAALIAARLAGRGADVALRGGWEGGGRRAWLVFAAPLVAATFGGTLLAGAMDGGPSWWSAWRARLWETRQITHLPQAQFFDAAFAREATLAAGRGLLLAAALGALAWALVIASRRRRAAAWALLALGGAELLSFAAGFRQTFSLAELISPDAIAYRRAHPGDFRVLDRARANGGLLSGLPDVWGDDPGVVRRYAEFVAATQGLPAAAAAQTLRIRGAHSRWDLLRFRAALAPQGERNVEVQEIDLNPLRRFEIVPQWEVRSGRDEVLRRVLGSAFDPRQTVILESLPEGLAADSSAGGGECMILPRERRRRRRARGRAARGILLMTDPFSRGWSAVARGGDAKTRYPVMPADWAFRATLYPSGTHELRIRIGPRARGRGGGERSGVDRPPGARSGGDARPGAGWRMAERSGRTVRRSALESLALVGITVAAPPRRGAGGHSRRVDDALSLYGRAEVELARRDVARAASSPRRWAIPRRCRRSCSSCSRVRRTRARRARPERARPRRQRAARAGARRAPDAPRGTRARGGGDLGQAPDQRRERGVAHVPQAPSRRDVPSRRASRVGALLPVGAPLGRDAHGGCAGAGACLSSARVHTGSVALPADLAALAREAARARDAKCARRRRRVPSALHSVRRLAVRRFSEGGERSRRRGRGERGASPASGAGLCAPGEALARAHVAASGLHFVLSGRERRPLGGYSSVRRPRSAHGVGDPAPSSLARRPGLGVGRLLAGFWTAGHAALRLGLLLLPAVVGVDRRRRDAASHASTCPPLDRRDRDARGGARSGGFPVRRRAGKTRSRSGSR
jgi:hypothetical protein